MDRRTDRQWRPTLLALEGRVVPTALVPAAMVGPATIHPDANGGGGGGGGSGHGNNGAGVSGFGVGTPAEVATPSELARERFAARFTRVQVGIGAGVAAGQARQLLYAGSGISNQFLQGRLVMRLFVPRDLANGQITGVAALRDRSITTSGAGLILNLTGSAADLDAAGRPTRLSWTVDANLSGSTYIGAVAANADGTTANADGTPATGTLVLSYGADVPPRRPGVNGGSATATFTGNIRTNNGVTDITQYENGHF